MLREAATPGAIESLARTAEPEFDAIVAAGGDGTINAVANGLAEPARPIAVLPLGTVNLLAREIGMPKQAAAIAEVIAAAPAAPIWPGRVGARLFLTVASAGIDAATVAAVDPVLKRRIGRLAFVRPALFQLRHSADCKLAIRVGGVEHEAAIVIAFKGRYYAGPFVAAPNARLGEPQLDLLLLPKARPAALLRYMAALAAGRLARLPEVVALRCRDARISAAGPVPVQADGEIVGQVPISLGIAAAPLMLIRPARPTV